MYMLTTALLFAVFAGILNGSYAAPFKSISWSVEAIWLLFSLVTFGILPWLTSWIMEPNILQLFHQIPYHTLFILGSCGLIFGFGMVLFTYSLRYVGIAVSFMLNISAGTIIGSLLPLALLDINKLLSTVGKIEMLALLMFLIGLILTTMAAKRRDKHLTQEHLYKGRHGMGILLGILSGLFCSAQGFTYSYNLPLFKTIGHTLHLSPFAVVNFPWCFIFNGALIPYFIFFLVKWYKKPRYLNKQQRHSTHNLLRLLVMIICYYASLLLFSFSGLQLGRLGSVIAWPLFMTMIVLTSNAWGFIQKEWLQAGQSARALNAGGIAFLILAILLLTLDGYLNLIQ